ncbi:type II secretion system F family protein, partial [Pelagibacteraceae bacterium]|nr:type II secretion system F family protein [Pelagibacteraceae bacterium]
MSETFTYKGISAGSYVEGNIEAVSLEEANFKLKEQKIIITNIIKSKKKKAEKEKKKGQGFSFGKKAVKPEDVMIFSKQFATMVKAGLPILNVLTMLRDQIEHPTMKEIIEDVRKSLEGGITLSKCFEQYPKIFD